MLSHVPLTLLLIAIGDADPRIRMHGLNSLTSADPVDSSETAEVRSRSREALVTIPRDESAASRRLSPPRAGGSARGSPTAVDHALQSPSVASPSVGVREADFLRQSLGSGLRRAAPPAGARDPISLIAAEQCGRSPDGLGVLAWAPVTSVGMWLPCPSRRCPRLRRGITGAPGPASRW